MKSLLESHSWCKRYLPKKQMYLNKSPIDFWLTEVLQKNYKPNKYKKNKIRN